jgi:RNA polymerase sigma factor (sigma-70 family)
MHTAAFLRFRPKCRSPPSPISFRAPPQKLIGEWKMKNWKKDRNYRNFKNEDGSSTYVIVVDGEPVKVGANIYKEYARSARQLEYIENDLKCDRILRDKNGKPVLDIKGHRVVLPELEVSLDKLIAEDWDFPSDDQPEDTVLRRVEATTLHRCLNMLDAAERMLIQALFFERKTEREYSADTGIHNMTIHSRKIKVLSKLKKLMNN